MIIGITGKIGSGKSIICEEFKKIGFIEDNFASSLKKIGEIFGFEHHQLYGSQTQKLEINNKWQISGREFMQKFGTDICRNSLPNIIPNMKLDNNTIWVQIIKNKIENEYKNKNIIIGDCRFEDESKMIVNYGGIIIKIVRTNNTNELTQSHSSEEQSHSSEEQSHSSEEQSHSSEKNIDKIIPHIIIYNNSSLDKYIEKIRFITNNINKIIEMQNFVI
jgi:hypothetical protein